MGIAVAIILHTCDNDSTYTLQLMWVPCFPVLSWTHVNRSTVPRWTFLWSMAHFVCVWGQGWGVDVLNDCSWVHFAQGELTSLCGDWTPPPGHTDPMSSTKVSLSQIVPKHFKSSLLSRQLVNRIDLDFLSDPVSSDIHNSNHQSGLRKSQEHRLFLVSLWQGRLWKIWGHELLVWGVSRILTLEMS